MGRFHGHLTAASKVLAGMIRKALITCQYMLISLSYFGWRPSVVYLSGRRRRSRF